MNTETPFSSLLIKEDILFGTYRKDLHINLPTAKQIVYERKAFTSGKEMPAIIISHGVSSIDKAAREFLASENGTAGLSATAIVVDSTFGRLMGNFFLVVNKTRIPVKIFSDVRKAESWLKQFVIKNKT